MGSIENMVEPGGVAGKAANSKKQKKRLKYVQIMHLSEFIRYGKEYRKRSPGFMLPVFKLVLFRWMRNAIVFNPVLTVCIQQHSKIYDIIVARNINVSSAV